MTLVSDRDTIGQHICEDEPDILVLDFDSNFATLEEHLAIYDELGTSEVPIVVMTDDMRRSTAMELAQRGAYDCVRKPPSLVELSVVLRRAYEHKTMKAELRHMREVMRAEREKSGCGQLVGSSGRSQVVYDLIRRVKDLNAYIMITGESGTGKELVARAIHSLSNRAMQPFVAVSCGAIPETLIEAELFGHEKGAYTGTVGSRPGYLEQAGEGTLLLDEIGELSLQTQVKLLRVLQQREFTRLGSTRTIPLKARVLFATHRNLEEMVEAGTFRRDLYFRVNVMRINVPALRDRTEDIPTLARHFLQRYSVMYEKEVRDIRPNAMQLLVEYDWPGNIRELENVIQGAVIIADGDSISPGELPEHIRQLEDEGEAEDLDADSFGDQLRHYKVKLAHKTILECNGNKSLAARKLRVSRAYLHRLIRMPESVGAA
ncbi:MAG TPA: sigma-54 dependent transcriptional regulator [Bryobacteraceae bacterium]|nr:sigma-54 dependent transcriptional regulator [Bryobacteraceae bacterium]